MANIEDLMIESFNDGAMCKGCLTKAMSSLSYQCPIHEVKQ